MEEVYDALSQAQKHIMLKNGMFEFDTFKPGTCCCNHSVAEHLDFSDLCLSRELCLCDRFLDKEAKITISPQKQQRVPKKEGQKQKEPEDVQLTGYIQTLARM
jgi:hypothetical protein